MPIINKIGLYKNHVLPNLLASAVEEKVEPNVPSLRPKKYEIVVDQAFINNLIQNLYELAEEKFGRTIGFIPSHKSENKLDRLVGEKASHLAKSLEEAFDIEQLKTFIEKSVMFFNVLDFVKSLQKIAKERQSSQIGLKPTPLANEDVILGMKAENLASPLIENPTPETAMQVDEFLVVNEFIKKLEKIADNKLNGSGLGFAAKPVSPRNKMIGLKAQELANAIKVNPNENNLMAAYNFLQKLESKKQEQIVKRRADCLGFHCGKEGEENLRKVAI